ncbi:hypothetical protein Tco_0494902, partial [Tanacetum coccineum]
ESHFLLIHQASDENPNLKLLSCPAALDGAVEWRFGGRNLEKMREI